jgi:hypothetical protein
MKNVHILPTDKPSRLFLNKVNNKLLLDSDTYCDLIKRLPSSNYQNLYITNSEEIKEGDWIIRDNEQPTLVTPNFFWDFGVKYYKISLTTDQDLIKDGVQAIDDEFLEWFVNNPSCEEVEIFKERYHGVEFIDDYPKGFFDYKIIIPQEEPKQTDENGKPITYWGGKEEPKHPKVLSEKGNELFFDEQGNIIKEEPKQETLEEAAINNYPEGDVWTIEQALIRRLAFMNGAKYQSERMYSEEEVKRLAFDFYYDMSRQMGVAENLISENATNVDVWFEQFKNV